MTPFAANITRLLDYASAARAREKRRAKPLYFADVNGKQVRNEMPTMQWGCIPRYSPVYTDLWHLDHDKLTAYGRACEAGGTFLDYPLVSGAPVTLDFEQGIAEAASAAAGYTLEEMYAIYRDAIRAFKAGGPSLKVGVYGHLFHPPDGWNYEAWQKPLTPERVEEIRPAAVRASVMLDECDFVVPSVYIANPTSADGDLAVDRNAILLAREFWPSKPIIPFICPNYAGKPGGPTLSPADAAKVLAFVDAECDGASAWGEWRPVAEVYLPLIQDRK